jgi:hypothetical protein
MRIGLPLSRRRDEEIVVHFVMALAFGQLRVGIRSDARVFLAV